MLTRLGVYVTLGNKVNTARGTEMTSDLTTTGADQMTQLMRLAVERGAEGVDALERLVALQERQQAIAAEAAHAAALSAFQQDCPSIAKNAKGAHNARYATLDHILDTVRAPLAMHGFAVTFDSEEVEGGRLKVWCIVHHALGHSTRASFTVSREAASNRMNDTQRDGSALSYGRRYALGLALNISTGERDDDGVGAAGEGGSREPVTAEEAANLIALAEEVHANLVPMFKWAGCTSFETFPAGKYAAAVKRLEGMRS